MTGQPVVVQEAIVYPPGVDLLDPNPNVYSFRLLVQYRGQGRWCVTKDDRGHQQMTHTGKWLTYPLKMTQLRWCRFDYPTALHLAQVHVHHLTLWGLTWAEWETFGHQRTPEAMALIRERHTAAQAHQETL